jgi:hypothetical protein
MGCREEPPDPTRKAAKSYQAFSPIFAYLMAHRSLAHGLLCGAREGTPCSSYSTLLEKMLR